MKASIVAAVIVTVAELFGQWARSLVLVVQRGPDMGSKSGKERLCCIKVKPPREGAPLKAHVNAADAF